MLFGFGLKHMQAAQIIFQRVEMRFGEFFYERDKRFDIRPDKRVGEEIGIPSRSAVGMNVLPAICPSRLKRFLSCANN